MIIVEECDQRSSVLWDVKLQLQGFELFSLVNLDNNKKSFDFRHLLVQWFESSHLSAKKAWTRRTEICYVKLNLIILRVALDRFLSLELCLRTKGL